MGNLIYCIKCNKKLNWLNKARIPYIGEEYENMCYMCAKKHEDKMHEEYKLEALRVRESSREMLERAEYFCREPTESEIKHNSEQAKKEAEDNRKRFKREFEINLKLKKVKGYVAECGNCSYKWKVRKDNSIPASCPKCNCKNVLMLWKNN